jgi:osmotically-inducible protein OsmY
MRPTFRRSSPSPALDPRRRPSGFFDATIVEALRLDANETAPAQSRENGVESDRRKNRGFPKEVEQMTTLAGSGALLPDIDHEAARELHARVANALHWSLAIPRNKIDIRVMGDCVTLRGVVQRTYEKSCAEALARRVLGVVGVRNEIEVRPENHL